MKRLVIQIGVLLGVTVIAAIATKQWHPYAPALYMTADPLKEGEVAIETALEWHKAENAFWIDARKRTEFEKAHVPGAMLLNEIEWDAILYDGGYETLVSNSDKRMIVYCGNRTCKASAKIAGMLREKRFPDVYVLKGGWGALQKAFAIR